MACFSISVDLVMAREGVFSDDEADGGGVTKYGISSGAYPALDVTDLTRQDASDIYAVDYWQPLNCDLIRWQRVADVVFDFAVNAGVKKSARTLQGVLGVRTDGIIGPKTIAAINGASPTEVAYLFTIARISYYAKVAQGRKSQLKFLVGWINRAVGAVGE